MTDRRRILVLSPYRAEYGPPQTLEHVCRALQRAGCEPAYVTPPGAAITPGLHALALDRHHADGFTTIPRTLNPARLQAFTRQHLKVARAIEVLARRSRAEGIYSVSEATFCGGLAARRIGIPNLTHAIGMSIRSPQPLAAGYIRLLDRLSDQFVACSSAVAEMLARHGVPDGKLFVVHNGVAASAIRDALAKAAEHGGRAPQVGMVAAYDPRKGHDLFVQSAAAVARRHPGARFVILGGAITGQRESMAFEARVRRMIANLGLADCFDLVGYVPPPDVYRRLRTLDVVVVPSRTEAFAHALVEAMLCERPVVATAVDGNLDAFVDGHSGLYVRPDPDAIADGVNRLLADSALRERLAGAAAKRAAMLYDTDSAEVALGEVVDRLLVRRG